MVKRSLYREALLNKLFEQEDKFFENFAKDYLIYLGNPKPTQVHIKEMKSILCETEVKRVVMLDKLTYYADNSCQRSGRKNDQITHKFSDKCLDRGVIYV